MRLPIGRQAFRVAQLIIAAAFLVVSFDGATFSEESAGVIPLAAEPHHFRLLHNDRVNIYRVRVDPHSSVLLHRHDFDAISVMLSDAKVSVSTPGRAPERHELVAGQVRLQPRGYIHSTTVEGDEEYRNVTVELLLPQEGGRNLCSKVIADQILHCPQANTPDNGKTIVLPQFESDEISVNSITLFPQARFQLVASDYPSLLIAVDGGLVQEDTRKKPPKVLGSGDFLWIAKTTARGSVKNDSDKPRRFVQLTFRTQ